MPTRSEDTIRILVSTDNHVGYEERHPVRGDDSWLTFDEIMQIAKKQDVDMVLLGGDLFHDNRPSRKSMYQVMRSLRKHCFGNKPCELEFLSDGAEVFEGAFPHVNYEDPDINVGIPVFSIHGNHDDPSGDGHYCSLDLLQAAGLVNYFGRVPEADNIHCKPILLQKGRTKMALYGLSNVRDERMHRTFRDNKVRFYRPNQQKDDWFNLLALHQNHYAHTETNYVAENMLPDFMDLVIWGHEHECLIDPVRNPETGFHVIQPGSSVATSLVPGEAVTKQIAILNITGKKFEVEKIPLKTVRPFVTREVVLASDPRFKSLDKVKNNRNEITKRLMVIVDEMIEEAKKEWRALHAEDDDMDDDAEPPLPLIRLKVEYTAPEGATYEIENPQRFSNRFTKKVANRNNVIQLYRKKKTAKKIDVAPGMPEALESAETIKVDTLVQQYFAQQELKLLSKAPFGDAVNQFVSKDDKHAVEMFVMESLSTSVKTLLQLEDEKIVDLDAHIDDFRKAMEKSFESGQFKQALRRRRFKPKPDNWDSDLDGHWINQPQALEEVPDEPEPKGRGRPSAKKVPTSGVTFSDEDEDMDIDNQPLPTRAAPKRGAAAKTTAAAKKAAPAWKAAPAKRAAPARKAPARGRKKKTPFIDSDEEDEEEYQEDEDEEEEKEEEEEDVVMVDDEEDPPAPPPKPKVTSRAASTRASARATPARATPARAAPARAIRTQATRATAGKKQTTLNFSQSQRAKGSQQQAIEISDDAISDDDDDAFESMPASRSRRK